MRTKPASQSRSREKRDRILAAMESLLRKKSFSEISVAELAAAAHVPAATIYQRFENRNATGSVLLELYFQRVEEWAGRPPNKRLLAITPLREALRLIARDGLRQITELGHIMRPAYLYSRQRPDLVGPEWSRLESLALQGFRELLSQRADQARIRDLDRAAALLSYFFNLMLLGPLLHDDSASQLFNDPERFAADLADMAYRYLACAEQPEGSA
jgi:AcrR family transcriptional regulator